MTFAAVICLLGLLLRAYFYLLNRSLWLDEATLALNIVNRSFPELFNPLDYNQAAPIGFLLLQKMVVTLLGNRDFILRSIPLLAGLASVPLMYSVSKRYCIGSAQLVSLGLFALSEWLIFYSSELKQYSTDVLTTLILLLIAPKCLEGKIKPIVTLGIAGIAGIWLSHPALFVCAGIFLTIGLTFLKRKDYRLLVWLSGIIAVWVINLIMIYLISLQYMASNSTLVEFHNDSFAPLSPWNDLGWYYKALISMLDNPAGLPATFMTLGLMIVGGFSFASRRWQLSMVLITPFLLALVASAFKKYPFNGRLLLFATPILFMMIAEGLERVRMTLTKVNKPITILLFAFTVIYLLYAPAVVAYHNVRARPMGEHIKPVMAYLRENYQKDDLIYLYYAAEPAFKFYSPMYGFDSDDYIVGTGDRNTPSQYLPDIDRLRGTKRVWFVFSHNCTWCPVNEEQFILGHLNKIGTMKDEFKSSDASVYLYNLEQHPLNPGN